MRSTIERVVIARDLAERVELSNFSTRSLTAMRDCHGSRQHHRSVANSPPKANTDRVTTLVNNLVAVAVLANDTDSYGDVLTALTIRSP
jgi:Bacterial cadherin-like domain